MLAIFRIDTDYRERRNVSKQIILPARTAELLLSFFFNVLPPQTLAVPVRSCPPPAPLLAF